MGVSTEAIDIMERDMVTDQGFIGGMVKAIHSTKSNGPTLDALNTKAFEVLDDVLGQIDSTTSISMYDWISK